MSNNQLVPKEGVPLLIKPLLNAMKESNVLATKGDELFQQENYERALKKYDSALDVMFNFMIESRKTIWTEASEEKGILPFEALRQNLYAIFHNLKRYPIMIDTLVKKAKCYEKLGYPYHAIQVCKSIQPLGFNKSSLETIITSSVKNCDVETFREAAIALTLSPECTMEVLKFTMEENEILKRDVNERMKKLNSQNEEDMILNHPMLDSFDKLLDRLLKGNKVGEKKFLKYLTSECSVSNVEIKKTLNMGLGMYATKDIAQGEIIVKENPFLTVTLLPEKYCGCCGGEMKKIFKCKNAGCNIENYCSEECREKSWKNYHSTICGFDQNKARFISSHGKQSSSRNLLFGIHFVSLIARKLFNIDMDKYGEETNLNLQFLRTLAPCRLNLVPYSTFADTLPPEFKLFEELSSDIVVGYQVKIMNNAFGDGHIPCLVHSLCKALSFANHSCIPNARFSCERASKGPCQWFFKALRDIKKGEEIFISYCGREPFSAEKRAAYLFHYGFVCECEKCKQDGANKILTEMFKEQKEIYSIE